ncbi:Serine-threonine/tyrosine-protein kinase, catalytic domain [Dillenia turbinata]|uniref:RING-type E3 ubiquitin transferase n=1 Tax=Dillenia turbinata TaxID=194707 RepID=A0AAN8W2C6_9MAGN
MSVIDGETPTVAVAVQGDGTSTGRGSRRALRWALDNLSTQSHRLILVHVMPSITSVPTPCMKFSLSAPGTCIPVEELDANVVAMYVQDRRADYQSVFYPFKKLCKTQKVETLLLEDNNPATALVKYASECDIKSLVLGSKSSNCILRKLRGPGVPSTVLKNAPDTCDVYVVSRRRTITKLAKTTSYREAIPSQNELAIGARCPKDQKSLLNLPCSLEARVEEMLSVPQRLELRYPNSYISTSVGSLESDYQNLGALNLQTEIASQCGSIASTDTEQADVQAEVEKLRLELRNTVAMYNRVCEDLVHVHSKVRLLSAECFEEESRVNAALEREEILRKIASEEKAKHLEAVKELEMAKNKFAKEAYERQIAEQSALKESLEKQKIVDALFSDDKRYRRYSREEIEVATDEFSETKMIGEGAYGKVYKCSLDHTPVAVKVIHPGGSDKREEYLRESGCLVYEYMENGSLEDYIHHRSGKPALPWFVRFRIVYEVACGLAFLHGSKPEPIIHRDLKPGNILLGRNFVSKIGDVGMAKIIKDIVPDNITEYRDSILAGTLFYMDPEYQRTGTVRPKSDLFAFGVITLQLLAARHPNGLIPLVEDAIAKGSLASVIDDSITDWPLAETEELAKIALKCSRLRCRDRPDLDTEVLPVLKKLADIADASRKIGNHSIYAPSHYFCPILQEVMHNPHIAADGFTYEHRAIKAWLEKHKISPVTKLRFQHTMLTPNHTLRSAIQGWRSRIKL